MERMVMTLATLFSPSFVLAANWNIPARRSNTPSMGVMPGFRVISGELEVGGVRLEAGDSGAIREETGLSLSAEQKLGLSSST